MSAFQAVVLAAGQGTRMKSARPKVLHALAGIPLVSHVLNAAVTAGADRLAIVTPLEREEFEALAQNSSVPTELFVQAERLGTAHAVLTARTWIERSHGPVLVLYGDTPLISPESLRKLADAIDGSDVAVMGFYPENPAGYGRLLTNASGELVAIREEKDASPEEREIRLCNSGIMGFRAGIILSLLDSIGNDNSQREYYLPDAVEIARARGLKVTFSIAEADEVRGVNTRKQLSEAEAILQTRLRTKAMDGGATLIDPGTVTFCADTIIGRDVVIEPHVIFGRGVVIEDEVTIKGFCHIEGAHIAKGAIIGPFARFRPGANIGRGVKIGNFVEIKKADIDAGAKVNHLSYVGDAAVGEGANIGAGTIVCNFDGFRKHRTEIGKGSFIGSNSSLVAPVKIGEGAYIGTGSVITRDVPSDALALARVPQTHREGWTVRYRARYGVGSAGEGGAKERTGSHSAAENKEDSSHEGSAKG